jgi:flagella basal body P-ring formation protein FlgA
MTPMTTRFTIAAAAALLMTFADTAAAVDLGESKPIRLIASVTVAEDVIRLGDLFGPEVARADKAVAQAPLPGQRVVLSSDWLAKQARSNGVDWQPAGPFDRAMVFRPGQTIQGADILAAVRAELQSHGMPENFGVKPYATINPVTVALNADKKIVVREAIYDAATNAFSAVAEIAPGDASAVYLPVRGTALPVVNVPALKQGLARNTVINAEMIEQIDVPEADIAVDTVMDANSLIGKAPRGYLKSGRAIRQAEIFHLTLTEIPVLRGELRRGGEIKASDIIWVAVNADDVPSDVVTDETHLIGKTPKRFLASRTAIRRSDVQTVDIVEVPVAARDIRRGTTLSAEDLNWVQMSEQDIIGEVVRDEKSLIGQIANAGVRAGQTFRAVSVVQPVAVAKGKSVTLIYHTRVMNLTAKGKALEDGAVGRVIRVVNAKSNQTVFAEVIDTDTVRVTEQQTAMN